jgi:CubicO group peptidase (beta-lactamase class C family)/D-alanyl-D-alanine dipeptidase
VTRQPIGGARAELALARALLVAIAVVAACAAPQRARDDEVLRTVSQDVRQHAMRLCAAFAIPGIWVSIVDRGDPGTEHRATFAVAGRGDVAIDPFATHRVASISKVFTATAAMRLVEQGRLALDRPVTDYLPDFAPRNPFGVPITLRHLLQHRAGLVRESPVGHYFDDGEPSLAATVRSLDDTTLVAAPGSTFKYSNPGFGVVGLLVERVTGEPFDDAVRRLVLDPLGLADSDFAPRPDLVAREARGVMHTYDGRVIPTPSFAFGYGPAANLRATVDDLATFATSWLPHGDRLLAAETLESMWRRHEDGSGCCLAFFVDELAGQRQVGHDGAVYGFASALRALPEHGLAVAVVATKDFANAVAEHVAEYALEAALAHRRGERLPPPPWPEAVGRDAALELAGTWRCGDNWVQLLHRDGELVYDPNIGVRTRLRREPDGGLVGHDVLSLGSRRLAFLPNGNPHDGQVEYVRDDREPAPPPAELQQLLGEYGWDHNVLVVYEDGGRLGVLIEWVVRDLPDREGPDRYRFPPGMYGGDQLVFERDDQGVVVAAVVGGARFPRRAMPDDDGFRVQPPRPVHDLLAEARRTRPPSFPPAERASDLVDLRTVAPTMRFDIRYATADNFVGAPVYPAAVAKLQRPAAEALARVHAALAAQGYGLCVFDAYRPWHVTKVFWDATPEALRHFVADPQQGSRHNRGCAVDLTLFRLDDGEVVGMPSAFDEFSPRASPDYPGGTAQQRHLREVLRRAMEREGFTAYEHEWWHFDHADWRRYGVGNEALAP